MHSQQPLKVETQLFADSLVDYYTTSCTEKVWHTPEPVLVQLASIFDTDPFFFFVEWIAFCPRLDRDLIVSGCENL